MYEVESRRYARVKTPITIAGKFAYEWLVSEEFSDAIKAYNFKDSDEANQILYAAERCWSKGLYSWCPADTKYLKKYLGMEV